MEYIFESIKDHEDYEQVAQQIFFRENKEKLEGKYTEEEFKSFSSVVKEKISKELGLHFKFILTFGTSITALFPIVENFILNSGISDINVGSDTVAYLTICALAIVFENPKEVYRKLMSELRLRNVYGLLEGLTIFLDKLKDLFNWVVSRFRNVTYDLFGTFNYTILFVPFALTLSKILSDNTVDLESFIGAFTDNGIMKLTTIGIGLTGVTLREIIFKLIESLPNFKFSDYKKYLSKSFSKISGKVRDFISSLKKIFDIESIKKDLIDREKEVVSDIRNTENDVSRDILKWDRWKKENDAEDAEQINEDK